MKKVLSSLFMKYMLTFIGIIISSTFVAPIIVFVYLGIDFRFAMRTTSSENAPSITHFAFIMGLVTIVISAVSIFIAVKRLVKPIKQISSASKRVANGNFDVHIDVSGDDEVSELAKNFNIMTSALSKNEYLHKEFVSNVSHEFKTPLTSLRGYAKFLKKSDLSEEKKQDCLDIIIAETERLSNLSSNLLRLSELENDMIGSSKEAYSLDEQIRDVLMLLQNDWEKKDLQIDLEMDVLQFTGDKALMYQIWVNLIGNAIKYSSQSGYLKIKLYQNNGIQVEIADSGIGMSSDEKERVFERFYKADSSRNSSGTGLGLSISKNDR